MAKKDAVTWTVVREYKESCSPEELLRKIVQRQLQLSKTMHYALPMQHTLHKEKPEP